MPIVNDQKKSRRKFLKWGGLGSMAIIATASFKNLLGIASKQSQQAAPTAKFLTQSGELVEVDIEKLQSTEKRITDEQVHDWINSKSITR